MADETTRLVMEIVGRDRGGKKTLTDVAKATDKAGESTKDLDQASDKAGKSLADMAKDGDKLTAEIAKTDKSIHDLAKQLKENPGDSGLFKQLNAEQAKMRRLLRVQDLLNPKEFEQGGEQAGVSLFAGFRKKFGPAQVGVFAKKGLSTGAAAAGGAALAAGAALGGTLMEGVKSAFEKSRADALLKAQLGKSVPTIGDLGKVSGKVYADNFGDSIEDVNQALKNVIRQGLVDAKNTSKQQLTAITEQVLTVAKVTEETTDRVSAAATQLVRTGLARNVTEALDLITAASQEGIDKSGDLLDTLNEYGTQFRKLGLSGPEALGLINQALQAGARDADTAGDALKEFAIRSIEFGGEASKAFRTLGLDADDFRDRFATGGDVAKQALGVVLDRLKAVRDPAQRAALQVELFGTKAEDLGGALNALDLDSASKEMDEFAGATERANKQMSSGAGGQYAALLRRLKGATVDYVSSLADANAKQAEFAVNIAKAYAAGSGHDGAATAATAKELAKNFGLAHESGKDLNSTLKVQATDLATAARNAGSLSAALDRITGANVDASRAESDYQAAVDDATAAIGKHVKSLNLGTQRGRDYNTQLLNIRDAAVRYAEATFNQTGSQDKANKIIAAGRTQLYNTARQMGLSKAEAKKYVDQVLRIPKSWTTKFNADTGSATSKVKGLHGLIKSLPSKKTIGVVVRLTGATNVSEIARNLAKARAEGGPVKRGQPYIVGEKRPELFVPDQNGTIVPNLNQVQRFKGSRTAAPTAATPAPVRLELAAERGANTGVASLIAYLVNNHYLSLKVANGRVMVGV